jgi:hypothetical protein
MKLAVGFVVVKILALLAVVGAAGCYPHTCSPNDTSCLPCPDPRNTNPACPPFPSDTKKPDAGARD